MPNLEPFIQHLIPYLLVAFRLAGLGLFAPLFSSIMIPFRIKGLLILMLAAAIYPAVPHHPVFDATLTVPQLLALILTESMIGFVVGLLASLPMLGAQAGGVIMGQQVGMGLGQVYNPAFDTESDPFSQLLSFLTTATFLAVGGLEGTFRAVLDTFRSIPIGAMSTALLPTDLVIGTLGSAFELALRVSAPVMAITFLLLAAFGFLGRTMPQFNVINIGFTIKIIAALAILAVSLATTNIAIGEELALTMRAILRWAHPSSGGIHG